MLHLSGTKITDAGLKTSHRGIDSQTLELTNTRITDAGLEYLEKQNRSPTF